MYDVFVASASDYNQAEIDAAVEYILRGCSIDKLVTSKSKVVLKPNLLIKVKPERAVTTHPAVVLAAIKALKSRGVQNIIVADGSSGLFTESRMNGIYSACGLTPLSEYGAVLNRDLSSTVCATKIEANPSFDILNVIKDADLVIGIAKLKTHSLTGVSAAVKNYYGAIPGLKKAELHFKYREKDDFGGMLCDLYEFLKPGISLIDAVIGMEGNGPSGGSPRKFGFVAGGQNAHYLDRAMCHMLGIDPRDALTVDTAINRGLAPKNAGDINIKGDVALFENPIKDIVMPSSFIKHTTMLPRFLRPAAGKIVNHLEPLPKVRKKDCTGCGMCAETCAANAIGIDTTAYIDDKKCIRCFCCHEVCPYLAIDIK